MGIRITDMSGIQMLESRLDSKWSGIVMPSKVWTQSPDFGQFYIKKTGQNVWISGGVSFIQRELSKQSYPQISEVKNYPEELSIKSQVKQHTNMDNSI